MIKKSITFVDYNGVPQTETYYFHLNARDVVKMTAKAGMDLIPYIESIAESEDLNTIVEFLEDIILTSVGMRSNNGANFIKNKTIRENFEYSEAYSTLFVELLENPDKASEFMSNLATTADVRPQAPVSIAQQQEEGLTEVAKLRARLAELEH